MNCIRFAGSRLFRDVALLVLPLTLSTHLKNDANWFDQIVACLRMPYTRLFCCLDGSAKEASRCQDAILLCLSSSCGCLLSLTWVVLVVVIRVSVSVRAMPIAKAKTARSPMFAAATLRRRSVLPKARSAPQTPIVRMVLSVAAGIVATHVVPKIRIVTPKITAMLSSVFAYPDPPPPAMKIANVRDNASVAILATVQGKPVTSNVASKMPIAAKAQAPKIPASNPSLVMTISNQAVSKVSAVASFLAVALIVEKAVAVRLTKISVSIIPHPARI